MKSDLVRRTSLVVGAALLVAALAILRRGTSDNVPRDGIVHCVAATACERCGCGDPVGGCQRAVHGRAGRRGGCNLGRSGHGAAPRRGSRAARRRRVRRHNVRRGDATGRRLASRRERGRDRGRDRVGGEPGDGPERAYKQGRADLRRLERQRDAAKARGRPVADIDIRIASTQEKMFDLEFLVKRLDALAKDKQRATKDATAAAKTADGAHAAVELVTRDLSVTEHRSGGWQGLAFGLAVLAMVIAAIPALARRSPRRRRARAPRVGAQPRPSAPPPMSAEDAILVEETLARARARRAGTHAAAPAGNGNSPAGNSPGSSHRQRIRAAHRA